MKRKLLVILYILLPVVLWGQIGINTTNPQEGVHVAGSTENIKVDGLNATNNVNNLGSNSTTKVFVDSDGDLVLGTMSDSNLEILVDSGNYLNDVEDPTSLIVQTGVNFGYEKAGIPTAGIAGASFTLTRNAILEVNYSVSWSIYDAQSLEFKRLDDLRSRVVQTGIYFIDTANETAIVNDIDGNPINGGPWCIDVSSSGTNCLEFGGLLGLTAQFYNNGNQDRGSYAGFINNASDYVKLGPGTYTALFAAYLQVEVINGGGAAKMFLGSGKDELQIIAHYYD